MSTRLGIGDPVKVVDEFERTGVTPRRGHMETRGAIDVGRGVRIIARGPNSLTFSTGLHPAGIAATLSAPARTLMHGGAWPTHWRDAFAAADELETLELVATIPSHVRALPDSSLTPLGR